MPLLREEDMRKRARRHAGASKTTVEAALKAASRVRRHRYDIFLSQTVRDAEIVLGVYDFLTEAGYAVFCDWIEAPLQDRHEVSPANAQFVRAAMAACDTLLFIDSAGAVQSLWMSWELGWFDGGRGPVAILPVAQGGDDQYFGREFLSLYPYVDLDANGRLRIVRPAVTSPAGITMFEAPNSTPFDSWRTDEHAQMRPKVHGAWRN